MTDNTPTPATPETTCGTYTVPECNLARLLEEVATLNKRASKLGVAPVVVATVPAYTEHQYTLPGGNGRRYWAQEDEVREGWTATGRVRQWHTVTVTGEAPKFAGWKLVGVLEPIALEDGGLENIVQAVPGEAVPTEYRTRVGQCDHCHAARRRNQTFVVRHDDGRTCMVGRQCLKDFLGHADPHALARWAEYLCELAGTCGNAENEEWLGGGAGVLAWDPTWFLTVTVAVVRECGWVSRTKAREAAEHGDYLQATADLVLLYLNPGPRPSEAERRFIADIDARLDPEFKENPAPVLAAAARLWAKELDVTGLGDDDYLRNVNLVGRAACVTPKMAGVAASIISAYQRAIAKEDEAKRLAALPPSQHVGTVGKRTEFVVRVLRVVATESNYGRNGSTGIHTLIEGDNNRMVWFASGSTEWLEQGRTYKVKATVKQHGEFNGKLQTVVNRVVVMEVLPEAAA